MRRVLARSILPVMVFIAVLMGHMAVSTRPLPTSPAQSRWAAPPPDDRSAFELYVDAGEHWLGLSYAISVVFAVLTIRRYREDRSCSTRDAAVGGVALSSLTAAGGCFLAGCCGSPMLAVYLNILGAGFLPFAKPLVTVVTLTSCLSMWVWLERRRNDSSACGVDCR